MFQRYGGDQAASEFEGDLGLPAGFFDRNGESNGGFDEAVEWLTNERPRHQNSWPALTLALIAQAERGLNLLDEPSLDDVFGRLEIQTTRQGGRAVNTLNFMIPVTGGAEGEQGDAGATLITLRPRYNEALMVVRTLMRRYGHPNNPGHATQSWPDYRPLIALIWSMSPTDRRDLCEWVWTEGVLTIEESVSVAAAARMIRPFERVLSEMPTASSRPGTIWQGICYGYLRADSPNVQLESHSAQTGSRRSGLLGDVDGFVGDRVALAAECKDRHIDTENWQDELGEFQSQTSQYPGITAIAMVATVDDDAAEEVVDAGLIILTREEMRRIVAVWDEAKQWSALEGLFYYLRRIQKSEAILTQVKAWCRDNRVPIDGDLEESALG